MSTSHPKFAVVGHPNKGKSTIVSTLAMDDSVQISNTPGTTSKQRSFPLCVDTQILYELFDTPGFQRARRVLAWLQQHDVTANQRASIVQSFIDTHQEDERFNDEIELLTPIMQGAGIIYIVDASKPYGREYEAEMEILRWTGQPSMALINHIEQSDYSVEWEKALGHYFSSVRMFNPMKSNLQQHLRILESMAQLKEEWILPIKYSITLFEQYHTQMLEQSALLLTRVVYDSLQHIEKISFESDEEKNQAKKSVPQRYKDKLRNIESKIQSKIEKVWNHHHIQKEEIDLALDGLDLFSKQTASIFGLTRKELMITAATSGAITGAGIDLLFAGHTLLLGGTIGAIVGGTGAYFGFDELSEVRVLGQKLGREYVQMGPMANKNFPYILLGRGLYYTFKIASKSHASKEVISVQVDSSFKEKWLNDARKKRLEGYHQKFRSEDESSLEELKAYERIIFDILKELISG